MGISHFPTRNCLSHNCLLQMYEQMLVIQFSYNFVAIEIAIEIESKTEIAPKNFSFFFQPQIEFCTQTNIFHKKNLHANLNFLSA